jgi:hypothetical protein
VVHHTGGQPVRDEDDARPALQSVRHNLQVQSKGILFSYNLGFCFVLFCFFFGFVILSFYDLSFFPSLWRLIPPLLTPEAVIILDTVYVRTLRPSDARKLLSGVLSKPHVLSRVIFVESFSKSHGLCRERLGCYFSASSDLFKALHVANISYSAGPGEYKGTECSCFTVNSLFLLVLFYYYYYFFFFFFLLLLLLLILTCRFSVPGPG